MVVLATNTTVADVVADAAAEQVTIRTLVIRPGRSSAPARPVFLDMGEGPSVVA